MAGENYFNNKIRSIYIVLFIFCTILVLAAARWQVIESDKFRSIANGRVYTSELTALRGSIYASDGTTLAYSEPRFDMHVWMKDLEYF